MSRQINIYLPKDWSCPQQEKFIRDLVDETRAHAKLHNLKFPERVGIGGSFNSSLVFVLYNTNAVRDLFLQMLKKHVCAIVECQ